jgi:hypothetical protein
LGPEAIDLLNNANVNLEAIAPGITTKKVETAMLTVFSFQRHTIDYDNHDFFHFP